MPLSKDYYKAIKHAKSVHESGCYTGKFLRPHVRFIKQIVDNLGVQSILDYGCGGGYQYIWLNDDGKTIEDEWGLIATKYDPAVTEFKREPVGKYDLVICTHVLGCIPEQDLNTIIDKIFSLANKAVYVAEAIPESEESSRSAKKAALKGGHFCPVARTALDWIDLLVPRKPPEIELHLAFRYRLGDKTLYGRFFVK